MRAAAHATPRSSTVTRRRRDKHIANQFRSSDLARINASTCAARHGGVNLRNEPIPPNEPGGMSMREEPIDVFVNAEDRLVSCA